MWDRNCTEADALECDLDEDRQQLSWTAEWWCTSSSASKSSSSMIAAPPSGCARASLIDCIWSDCSLISPIILSTLSMSNSCMVCLLVFAACCMTCKKHNPNQLQAHRVQSNTGLNRSVPTSLMLTWRSKFARSSNGLGEERGKKEDGLTHGPSLPEGNLGGIRVIRRYLTSKNVLWSLVSVRWEVWGKACDCSLLLWHIGSHHQRDQSTNKINTKNAATTTVLESPVAWLECKDILSFSRGALCIQFGLGGKTSSPQLGLLLC